jgi:hypothetical protein
MSNSKNVAATRRLGMRRIIALRLVITLLFIPAILDRLMDPGEYARLFTSWGYPAWGPIVICIAEILALLALWVRGLASMALAVLMLTLSGATATWLIHGPRATAAYPGTILALVCALAWFDGTRRRRVTREQEPTG